MTTTSSTNTLTLPPSYALPIALVLLALPIALVQLWVAGALSLFGLFLLYQTVTLRLVFTETALEVYRGETQIRQFPYREWQNWEIFWPPVPILFYFREVKSIHFVPILFDPKRLRSQLEQHVPKPTA